MNIKSFLLVGLSCFIWVCSANAQNDISLQAIKLDSSLTKDANAIVRSQEVLVELNSINAMTVTTKRVVTVLNKLGDGHADSHVFYAPSIKIKKLEATVLNALGLAIKKYKKKDFHDQSAYDGFSLAMDDRIKYFEYTPVAYPYTIVFESEIAYESTLGIPGWAPIGSTRVSTENSLFTIRNNSDVELRFKESNFDKYPIRKTEEGNSISYRTSHISAIKREAYSPGLRDMVPFLRVVPNHFTLEDIEGRAENWESFGKWMYDKLVSGRNQLPAKTISEVTEMTKNAANVKEKAKLIYEYVQNKTRYVSVQLGIGGWMPFEASEVDRLGYGDCKALTNYTKALLESQKIPSYYTVVYGDNNIRNIDQDFASLQGNHVILNIPDEDEDIWLECTSQTTPFNFIAGFTDDRDVLVVKPEGGEIKHTKKYTPEENSLHCAGIVNILSDGAFKGTIEMKSGGIQYNQHYGVQTESEKDQKTYYKKYWNYINGLEINTISHHDNKEEAIFSENVTLHTARYATKTGTRLLVNPNIFNRYTRKLPKYKDRKMPLKIARGFVDTDTYTLNIPTNYAIQSIPEKKVITNEFGNYSWELEKISDTQLKFKRELRVESGMYAKEKYKEYRQFMLDVAKADASKIILKQL